MDIALILLISIMVGGGLAATYYYSNCSAGCVYLFKVCLNDLEELNTDIDEDKPVDNSAAIRKVMVTYSQAYKYMEDAAKVCMDVIIIEMVLFAVVCAVAVWLYS